MSGLYPPGRIDRIKSRTGCKTCKVRRVKCGEEKPSCVRCSSTGRRCDYTNTATAAQSAVARALPTISAESRERRAFEYYYFSAAPSLSDALDLDFWRGTVLQICRSEPAVWDAIVALSTLYEHPLHPGSRATYQIDETDRLPSPRSRSHREALTWYSRSLRKIQHQIDQGLADYTVALVTCVLFLCIEILQGNIKAAMSLYHRGVQLLSSAGSASISRIRKAILPLFLRVATSAVIISGVEPVLDRQYIDPSGDAFTSLSDARTALHKLVADWKMLDCDCAALRQVPEASLHIPRPLQHRRDILEGNLLAWYRLFCEMPEVSKSSSPTRAEHQGVIATLQMTYKSILILTRTAFSATETSYDAHEAYFADILSRAPTALAATARETGQQPPFTFDMGSGTPLFITALKCRTPSMRRRALRLLRQAPHVQGMYFSQSASDFLAAIVAVEEGGGHCSEEELSFTSVITRPGIVPEESRRVFSLQLVPWTTTEGDKRTALKYSRRDLIDGKVQVVNDVVVLPAPSPHRALSIL
ncbi:hypothetical protein BJX68DRAFT_172989 [Aspergillus pseudodeflectus]|uniref:Zn(2)-C6 fungal-type domain-containing protein n=1 Tax=Aspergillus pseudodeflectus TaxID=176178 RepID=A0ABR4JND8_9EURO